MREEKSGKAPSKNFEAEPAKVRWDWLFLLVLAAIVTLAYRPAWNGSPIWDDDKYITPPHLQPLSGLVKIWTQPGTTAQFYPLAYSFFWVEHRLWGTNPLGYHFVNIVLHVLSSMLLLRILRYLGIPGARLATVLFALHPVQVESVAWISELKNTLSGVFFFAAALTYLKFRFDPRRRWGLYTAALVWFLIGLLSKTAIAVLPGVLLVVTWWKLGRLTWKNDVAPLLPFFSVSAGFGLLTAWMERKFVGAVGADFQLSFVERCLVAGRALCFYFQKLLWPDQLTFIYPRWDVSQGVWWQYLFPAAVIALLITLWIFRKRSRSPLAAILLFAGMLFPALGFIDIYPFLYSYVADHFQYLACVAPLTFLAACTTEIFSLLKLPSRRLLEPLSAAILAGVLSILTWQQSSMYVDIETLWKVTIARNPSCWMAYSNLGALWVQHNNLEPAIRSLEKALAIRPDAEAYTNLGIALQQQGLTDAALSRFRQAIQIRPDYAEPYNDIGTILHQRGDLDGAIAEIGKAVDLKPDFAEAHFNLGIVLLQKGVVEGAIEHFQSAAAMLTDDAEVHVQLGLALQKTGRADAAIAEYKTALQLKPDYVEANRHLGLLFRQMGKTAEAIAHLNKAYAQEPADVRTLNSLARVESDRQRAITLAERAVQLTRAADPETLHTLSLAYAGSGHFQDAIAAARRALQLADGIPDPKLAHALRNEIAAYEQRKTP